MESQDIGWDACCLLNLIATRQAETILRSMGGRALVVRQVLDGEVLSFRPLPEEDPTGAFIDAKGLVEKLIHEGMLQIVELSELEQSVFVDLATMMDDGEARTIAVALSRGWSVATDDIQATRILQEHYPHVPVLATPDWLKCWSDAVNDNASVADAIRRIEHCARFKVQRVHRLREWWLSLRLPFS